MPNKPRIHAALAVDARDFPPEIDDWLVDNDYSTHYQNDLVMLTRVQDDDPDHLDKDCERQCKPFVDWLESIGVTIPWAGRYAWIGIIST